MRTPRSGPNFPLVRRTRSWRAIPITSFLKPRRHLYTRLSPFGRDMHTASRPRLTFPMDMPNSNRTAHGSDGRNGELLTAWTEIYNSISTFHNDWPQWSARISTG